MKPWPTPDGGFERLVERPRRRHSLRRLGIYWLGFGIGYVAFGLIDHSATNAWLGVAVTSFGVIVLGIHLGRVLIRNRVARRGAST